MVAWQTPLEACLISLMSVEGSVVPDIPRLLLDEAFRNQILQHVTDPVTLDYWELEFGRSTSKIKLEIWPDRSTRGFAGSIVTRRCAESLGRLTVSISQASSQAKRSSWPTSRGATTLVGHSIGALLMIQFQMAAIARAHQARANRTPFYLYVDEVQNFVVSSIPEMLSEAGKYGIYLVIANQYIGQMGADTVRSVLGNVGTNIIFRAGREEVTHFSPLIEPTFSGEDLLNLSRFRAIVKTQLHGKTFAGLPHRHQPTATSRPTRDWRCKTDSGEESAEVWQVGGGDRR